MERTEDLRRRFLGVGCGEGVTSTLSIVEVEIMLLSNSSEGIASSEVAGRRFRSSAPDGGVNACSSEREYVEMGVGGLSSLLLDRDTAVSISSECILRWPVSNHLPESTCSNSGLVGLPSNGLSS
jgi:hypothetical protein